FSSRRRHTRSTRDWSSDVCSSDLAVTQAQRKIPVQYAQRAVGRKVYAGSSSFMPLRVNYAGVMPIIFAQAILMFPAMVFLKLGQIGRASCRERVENAGCTECEN